MGRSSEKGDEQLKTLYSHLYGGDAEVKGSKERMAHWLDQLDLTSPADHAEMESGRERSLHELKGRIVESLPLRGSRRVWRYWVGIAAAMVLLAMGVLMTNRMEPKQVQSEDRSVSIYTEITTAPGQRKLVILPDSSQVWLNNASTIRYPKSFSGAMRSVELRGQAFFEVKTDTLKPFLIHASGLDIRVLGTSFDVRHYDTDLFCRVTVATGKVSVRPNQQTYTGMPPHPGSWIMEPGQQLTYDPLNLTGVVHHADIGEVLSWKSGELIFRDAELGFVLQELERWYNVSITNNPSRLAAGRVSLTVSNEPLETVLKMLSRAAGFQFEMTGKTINIWQ